MQRGFTVTELALAIAIVAMAALASAPLARQAYMRHQVKIAATEVQSIVQRARMSALKEKISDAENKLVRSYKNGSVSVLQYPPSAYLTQLVTRVLLKRKKLSEKLKTNIAEWAQAEIGRQFGLLLAKSKNADVFQLGYCIILAATVVNPAEATPDYSRLLVDRV